MKEKDLVCCFFVLSLPEHLLLFVCSHPDSDGLANSELDWIWLADIFSAAYSNDHGYAIHHLHTDAIG